MGFVQKVLLVDDSPDIHHLVGTILSSPSLVVLHAQGGKEGLEVALRERPNLILLDYMMPDIDGLTILKQIQNDPNYAALSTTPVMLITGHDSPAFITQAFAVGAIDYIRKPVNAAELQVRVATCLRSQALVKDLYRRVMYDELTGLPNRAYLLDRVTEAIRRNQKAPDDQFALILLDFDRFKLINDSLGHEAGNTLLKQAAQRLKNQLAPEGSSSQSTSGTMIARLGGDVFAILLTAIRARRSVEDIAVTLSSTLGEKYLLNGRVIYLDTSFGIVFSQSRYKQADEVLRDADTALHAAKAAGRGCLKVYDNSMRLRSESLLQLDSDLRQAIEKEQFLLLYQPILDLHSGKVTSVEALVRWNHPQRGWISPLEFIPAAEESGLIIDLGAWIVRAACKQLASWQKSQPELAPPHVNVNVARLQLLEPDFPSIVQQALQEFEIAPHQLTLEVTESGVMNDVTRSIQALDELRKIGCQIHLDDFGTGYSSLSCLYQFPIDALKLDRSLVSNLSGKHYLGSLVNFVLQLANAMNLRVIAEGIESLEQAQTLARWGCDYGQGFYFAKPLVEQSIPAFVGNAKKSNLTDPSAVRDTPAQLPTDVGISPSLPLVSAFEATSIL